MFKWLMKNKIPVIIILSIAAGVALFLILFFNIPRITYTYDKQADAYYVSTVYGNEREYTIPEKYNGKDVIGIDTRAFYEKTNLEEIHFENPSNISRINRLAFSKCYKLKTIDLGNVSLIERNAFSYCYSIDNLEISAEYIGASAFYKCESLKNITLNSGVSSIGSMAFSYTAIENLKLPETVKSVYEDAFLYMDALKTLSVPEKLNTNEYIKTLNMVQYY